MELDASIGICALSTMLGIWQVSQMFAAEVGKQRPQRRRALTACVPACVPGIVKWMVEPLLVENTGTILFYLGFSFLLFPEACLVADGLHFSSFFRVIMLGLFSCRYEYIQANFSQ